MKKVLHILYELLPSGAETMLSSSAELWDGYEKYILATGPTEGSYADNLRLAGYHVIYIHNNNFLMQHREVRKFIRKNQFDVIHIHVEGQAVFYAFDVWSQGVKSVVRTVHNCFCFNGILRYRRILTRSLERLFGVRFIALGESVEKNERDRFYNKGNRVIRNWCNTDVYHYITEEEQTAARTELKIPEDTFAILSVGNCNELKNHSLLLQTLHKCIPMTDVKIKYYHVGSGELESNERRLADELNLNETVVFTGRQQPKEYLAAANLYVMPSILEGLPIAALEAICCGLPVLFADTPGLSDFHILKNENIFFAEPNEIEMARQLMNCINQFREKRLKNSPEEAQEAMNVFNMQKSVKQYLNLYNKK